MGKTALLVMDLQQDYLAESARLPIAKHQVQPLCETVNGLVRTLARAEQQHDVLYIVNEFEPKQWLGNLFRSYATMKGQLGSEIDSRVARINDRVYVKKSPSAFTNPQVAHDLQQEHIDTLLVTGVFAEGCVSHTVRHALRAGYQVVVLTDAVGGATDHKRDNAIRKMNGWGATTISSAEYLAQLY